MQSTTDILRPTVCRECSYSLTGLPAVGRCPECGAAYDDRFVILHGKAFGRLATVNNSGWGFFVFSTITMAAVLIVQGVKNWGEPLLMFAGVLWVASLVFAILERYTNVRPGLVELILCDRGHVQRNSVPAKSLLSVLSRFTAYAWIAAVGLSVVIKETWEGVIPFALALVLVVAVGKYEQRRRKKLLLDQPLPSGENVRILPWFRTGDVEIKVLYDDVCQIEIFTDAKSFGSRHSAVAIETKLSTDQSAALRERIEAWRKAPVCAVDASIAQP